MREYILIMALVLLFGCIVSPPAANNTTGNTTILTPVSNNSTTNNSASMNTTPPLPANYTVQFGDTVWVNYTLWVDGKVLDTSNATLANESGIFNPNRKYEPLMFEVALNKGIIDGFVLNTVGMTVNETLVYEVEPKRGYGPWDPEKVIVVPRYYNRSNFEVVPRSYFEGSGLNLSVGEGFDTDYGTVFINATNDENITLFYLFDKDVFSVNGIPQSVHSFNSNFTVTIEYLLEMNKTYALPNPVTGMSNLFKVTNKTDQNITLDGNHPLANKTLTFQVTLVNVSKPS